LNAPPKKAEAKMLRLILPDFLLLFFILAIAGNAAVIASGIVKFPQVLLLVPAISILAAIIAFARFYNYLSTVLRVMGALSLVYEELGGGKADVRIAFPKPLLLFGFLSAKAFSKSQDRKFAFSMKSDSAKYQAQATIGIDHGYYLDIKITDWRHQEHSRSARGRLPKLQNAVIGVIDDIRKSVLESKGVPVQKIVVEHEGYLPKPAKRIVPVPQKHPVQKGQPEARMPQKQAIQPQLAILPPILEKRAVEQKADEVKAQLSAAKKEPDKEALQDILYQLEEINKIIKKKG